MSNPFEEMPIAIEAELQRRVSQLDTAGTREFHEMLTYHMGWTGEGAGPEATGKRVRPMLLLLTAAACGSDWKPALPAAAAVELVHCFSLVHDDIEDSSRLRRGRPALWVRWGIPMATNAGDALLVLAWQSITELAPTYSSARISQSARVLQEACLSLTRGQFLDMSYETRSDLGVDDYWPMVSGKTAALLAACCQIGAILGGAPTSRQESYRSFGRDLGLAFQVEDDLLGIWGDEALTGKSRSSDLVDGKKSLPVLFGLSIGGRFAARWRQGPISVAEVPSLAEVLMEEGAYAYTQSKADELTEAAVKSLRAAGPVGAASEALERMAGSLLKRAA
jgi:geranylgeranyl diphosphate synthase type I